MIILKMLAGNRYNSVIFGQCGLNDKIVSNHNLWFIENINTHLYTKACHVSILHENKCNNNSATNITQQSWVNNAP
jgi:hypothetical protein